MLQLLNAKDKTCKKIKTVQRPCQRGDMGRQGTRGGEKTKERQRDEGEADRRDRRYQTGFVFITSQGKAGGKPEALAR